MKKIINVCLSIMLIFSVFLVADTLEAASGPGKPQSGGTLKIITFPPPLIGYPPEFRMGPTRISASPCLESLTAMDKKGRFIPTKLCTAWELSPDGKVITLTLRRGVKFHDGTEFNAAAVKWNLEKAMEKKRSETATFTSVEVVDNFTVRINVKYFRNNTILRLPMMISPTAVEKNGIEWAKVNPVGTGPFKFVKYERGNRLTFTKWEGYWEKGKPYLDGMEFIFIRDPMTQQAAMQARGDEKVHVLAVTSGEQTAMLRAKGFKDITMY